MCKQDSFLRHLEIKGHQTVEIYVQGRYMWNITLLSNIKAKSEKILECECLNVAGARGKETLASASDIVNILEN